MTLRRRLAVIGGVLLLAVLAALLVAPEFIDWNRYRGDTAEIIARRLGRAVSIDGPLSLSLLPAPHLVAEKAAPCQSSRRGRRRVRRCRASVVAAGHAAAAGRTIRRLVAGSGKTADPSRAHGRWAGQLALRPHRQRRSGRAGPQRRARRRRDRRPGIAAGRIEGRTHLIPPSARRHGDRGRDRWRGRRQLGRRAVEDPSARQDQRRRARNRGRARPIFGERYARRSHAGIGRRCRPPGDRRRVERPRRSHVVHRPYRVQGGACRSPGRFVRDRRRARRADRGEGRPDRQFARGRHAESHGRSAGRVIVGLRGGQSGRRPAARHQIGDRASRSRALDRDRA